MTTTTNLELRCADCGWRLAPVSGDCAIVIWAHVDADGHFTERECKPRLDTNYISELSMWRLASEVVEWKDTARDEALLSKETTEQRDALSDSLDQAHASNLACAVRMDAQQEEIRQNAERIEALVGQVAAAKRELTDFKSYVVQSTIDYSQGCMSGKRDFISELGLEWPTQDYVVTIRVRGMVGDEEETVATYVNRVRDSYVNMGPDDLDLLDVDWETD